ncbi:hypothetical protein [Aminipila sp.]|uniref:hypothetical protein n=1 Tax=Aminipila sp. TaxID=2060095 RepID=UPI0028979633|nr:hypothetical protein [Aminipila sp.]
MIALKKNKSNKVIAEKNFTKEELSAYNLYIINGCSQNNTKIKKPAFIGSYH